MNEKEFIHVEVDPNYQMRAQINCSPVTLVVIIASILIQTSKNQNGMPLRKMLEDIIRLTDVLEVEDDESQKAAEQMIDEVLRRIDE